MSARLRYRPWFRTPSSMEELMRDILAGELTLHGWVYSVEGERVVLEQTKSDGYWCRISYPASWVEATPRAAGSETNRRTR